MVWRAPKRSPAEFPAKGSKIDTWLGVMQSALGSSDSSSSKTKIISLIHALIPSAKAKSAFNAKPAVIIQNSKSILKLSLLLLAKIL